MHIVGVIPARFGSSRFPGKPLVPIGSKPLLQWVIEGASQSQKINEIIVATDDSRIEELVTSLGVKCVMTDSDLPTGSDRIWQAINGLPADVVVNVQGDEPLIDGSTLDALVEPFFHRAELNMATLAREMRAEELDNKNVAKIVTNKQGDAIYFSRSPIPYSRGIRGGEEVSGCMKHIGIYAYRVPFLQEFCKQGPVAIEKAEGLEQLRALYLGAKIHVVSVNQDSWGVDTPEDISFVEKKLREKYGHV